MNKYFINSLYKERDDENYFNDINNKDEWQNEVYLFAKNIFIENNFNSILDYGCGSGFKLIKYFSNYKYIGLDLEKTINLINNKNFIPIERINFNKFNKNFDMVICSDVIEHVKDPDIILNNIKKINSKYIVISTPDRSLVYNQFEEGINGPPKNISHIREWNFEEFKNYIEYNNFEIIKHFISNEKQATQCMLIRNKK